MGKRLDNATALYMEGIRDGRAREAVTRYTGDRYTQHSTGVRDGVEGFVAFFAGDFLERNPVRHIEVVRGWEDGRHVFVQAFQSLNGGEQEWVTTDFFDTDEDGLIIEHWDVISQFRGPTLSGHTQVDGPTEPTDLDKTDTNKALVRRMLEQRRFEGANRDGVDAFVSPDCVEHTLDDPPVYQEIVLCVGQGNFVATLCRASRDGQPLCQCDIFRVEDGLIVEHWDNAEPVPSNPVNSGKF